MDEPLVLHPVVRACELEAIRQLRGRHPDAPPWQELAHETRSMWIDHVERSGWKFVPPTPEGATQHG